MSAGAAGGASRVRILRPLRGGDFRLLWTGMSVSLLGDGVFLVALAWQVYELSDVPTAMAAVGVAMSAPQVALLLLGGVVADRVERRLVMAASDTVRGAGLLVAGLLAVSGHLTLWHLYVVAALYGAATGFFGPAFDAVVPDLVPQELLAEANALDQVARPVALRVVGPALGGVVVAAAGAGTAFLVDAASFAVAVGCVARITRRPPASDAAEETAWQAVRGGLRYVRGNVWLWGTFGAATLAYLLFLGPTEVLLPYLVKNELHATARDLGIVLTSGGLGALAAAAIVGQRGVPRRFITFMYATWALGTLTVAGYGLSTGTWQLAAACALVNGLEAAGTVAWATAKHRLVPGPLLGRVSSVDWFISMALVPASYALTAPVVAAIGVRDTLVGAGLVGAAVTAAALLLPGMRAVEQHSARHAPTSPLATEAAA